MDPTPHTARATNDEHLDAELAAHHIPAAEFRGVDYRAPLDVEARVAAVPAAATAKGMFFEPLAQAVRPHGVACEPRYVAFRDYPLRDFMRLLASCASVHHRALPTREAMRQLGREAFSTLMGSVAGRVIFTFALGDARSALRLAPEGYKLSLSHCTARTRLNAPEQVVLELRDVWNFPECYQVGVIEGGCMAFGPPPRIRTRVLSACDVDLLIRW